MAPPDRFEDIQLIGDELHFSGELVALLVSTAPASIIGRFEDLFLFGEDPLPEDENACECPPRLHKKACACYKAEDGEPLDTDELDHLMDMAQRFAKGGLLRITDLARIIARLKEGKS